MLSVSPDPQTKGPVSVSRNKYAEIVIIWQQGTPNTNVSRDFVIIEQKATIRPFFLRGPTETLQAIRKVYERFL
jgi:hypothetical protein